jgi:hypothetical protein
MPVPRHFGWSGLGVILQRSSSTLAMCSGVLPGKLGPAATWLSWDSKLRDTPDSQYLFSYRNRE